MIAVPTSICMEVPLKMFVAVASLRRMKLSVWEKQSRNSAIAVCCSFKSRRKFQILCVRAPLAGRPKLPKAPQSGEAWQSMVKPKPSSFQGLRVSHRLPGSNKHNQAQTSIKILERVAVCHIARVVAESAAKGHAVKQWHAGPEAFAQSLLDLADKT